MLEPAQVLLAPTRSHANKLPSAHEGSVKMFRATRNSDQVSGWMHQPRHLPIGLWRLAWSIAWLRAVNPLKTNPPNEADL